jgi:glycine cleavage system transcriptional repressor
MTKERVYLVLTALGTDRPGIVEKVSQFILGHGGNIEESQMAVLGGEFALMLLVSGGEAAAAAIEAEAEDLAEVMELRTLVKRTAAPETRPGRGALAYRLHATSLDHPGIVNHVSQLVAAHGVNIERAECAARPGPWSGTPVFHLEMTLAAPDQSTVTRLREALAHLGGDEGIDIELSAVK